MRKIIILSYAEQDIRDSVVHYNENEKGLDKHFLAIINQAFQLISSKPFAFPFVKNPIRKFVIRDFPFNVYFVVEDDIVYILAVFHNKRNPKVWKTRKRK
jgi:plasmid stabilization system protein ParE